MERGKQGRFGFEFHRDSSRRKKKAAEEEDQGHLMFTSSHPRPNSSWDNFTILVHDTVTCNFHNQLDLTCIAFT